MTVISYYYIGPPLKFTQDSTPTRLGIHVVPSNNEAERQKMSQSAGQSVRHLFEKTLVNEARTLFYGLF